MNDLADMLSSAKEQGIKEGYEQGRADTIKELSVKDCDSCELKIVKQIRENAIDEFVKAIEKHQTRQDSYFEPPYFEMGLDMTDILEVAKQLKEKK